MGKVVVTVEIDVPGSEDMSDLQLFDAVSEGYTSYVHLCHLHDTMRWCGKASRAEKEDPESQMTLGAKQLTNFHATWAKIAEQAKIKFARG